MKLCKLIKVGILLTTLSQSLIAQEAAIKPLELERLHQQYETKAAALVLPLTDRYKIELQRLENNLIQQKRLEDALAVKKFREDMNKPDEIAPQKPEEKPIVKSAAELTKLLYDTWWVAYHISDEKHLKPLDMYCFQKGDTLISFTGTSDPWPFTCNSAKEVQANLGGGRIMFFTMNARLNEASIKDGENKNMILVRVSPIGGVK